jgi:hypothetical protein
MFKKLKSFPIEIFLYENGDANVSYHHRACSLRMCGEYSFVLCLIFCIRICFGTFAPISFTEEVHIKIIHLGLADKEVVLSSI